MSLVTRRGRECYATPMRIVNLLVPGWVVTDDVQLNGLAEGDLVVSSSATLELNGTVIGTVIVKEGGRATISGTIKGGVVNEGGEVTVLGVVDYISDIGGTRTFVDPLAVVRG